MKPPVIPFVPLILKGQRVPSTYHACCAHAPPPRPIPLSLPSPGSGVPSSRPVSPPPDLTFLHESSKTLVDGLVNLEKLVSSAEELHLLLSPPCACPPATFPSGHANS